MIGRRALPLAGAGLLAAPLLSGCVAAAIPVLAAGGVVGTQVRGDENDGVAQAAPQVAVDASPGYILADGTRARVVGGALPAPAGPRPAASEYEPLLAYASVQGALPAAGSVRRSAILADPGTLAPATRECSIHPAAVVIDLDPAGGVLDPAQALRADARLAGALAALRGEGLAIVWLSATTADRAGAVRRALAGSGLDPAGRDELALLRYPEERKQTRRAEIAKEFCVLAIAGDDRRDFDELFDYLKDKSLAAPLDALLGNGWFLIPQPLT